MLLCFGWLQSAATSSSAKKVLNVPLRARLRAFFACILVAADFAHPRYEVHLCYALLELVSKVSSAAVDDMRAATSSNFAKKSLSVSQWTHLRFFPSFSSSRLASRQPRYEATFETSSSFCPGGQKLTSNRLLMVHEHRRLLACHDLWSDNYLFHAGIARNVVHDLEHARFDYRS